jgi:hypothetical protein
MFLDCTYNNITFIILFLVGIIEKLGLKIKHRAEANLIY